MPHSALKPKQPAIPIPPADDFETLHKLFGTYRDYLKVEHDLQNHRSTWHLAAQALLFTALGVIGNSKVSESLIVDLPTTSICLPYMLIIVGLVIAAGAATSIHAANLAIKTLSKRWDLAKTQFSPQSVMLLPEIKGGGSLCAERLGKVTPLFIPYAALAVWAILLCMYIYDKKITAGNPPKPNEVSRFIPIVNGTHADLELDSVTGTYCKAWDWKPEDASDKSPIYSLKTCNQLLQESLKRK